MDFQALLDKVQAGMGIADFALDVLPGLTPDIAQAIAAAELDATSANVQAVVQAYADEGSIPPAKLMAHLLIVNEQQHPEDTVKGALAPWLIGGGIILYLLFRKRR
jgi:hypothetical protein